MTNGPPVAESSSSTSASLINRVRDLDPEAWQRLSELYGPVVYHWARQAGLRSSDATDVGQEVFRTVASRITTFRREQAGDSFRGWLWGITRNKLKEHNRRRAADPRAIGGSDAAEQLAGQADLLPDDSVDLEKTDVRADIMHRTLQMIRGDFEDKTWQAFWRMTVDDERAADIAPDLDMSPKAVRQAKFRVLQRLRQEIDELL
jgi:RNA polymerase sigma-70 factor (ECF subfamily)